MNPVDLLPLREPTFYILLSLAPGDKHGYAILKDVENLSSGKLRLGTGTLYGALSRLLDQGLIAPVDAPGGGPGRPRRAYRLTGDGRSVLAAEVERMERLLAAARLNWSQEQT